MFLGDLVLRKCQLSTIIHISITTTVSVKNYHRKYRRTLTSLRSSTPGRSHSKDLSSRPGRSNVESMRSGRLAEDQPMERGGGCDDVPRCSENIDTLEPLSAIHLGQHLIYNAVCDARAIMSSAHKHSALANRTQDNGNTFWVRSSQTHRKKARRAWQP